MTAIEADRAALRFCAALAGSFVVNLLVIITITTLAMRHVEKKKFDYVEITRLVLKPPEPEVEEKQAPAPPPKVESNVVKTVPTPLPIKKATPKPRVVPTPEPTPPPAAAAPSAAEPGDVSGTPGGVPAVALSQVNPEIPDSLKTNEYKSYVRVKVEIAPDGTTEASLRTSSGNAEIDKRVLAALQKWKWRPASIYGEPVGSVQYFKFEFEVR